MSKFNHFLLTRFNIKSDTGFDLVRSEPEKTIYNPEWLEDRFKRFERYCYPSVKSQSNKNFKWLVFFDINTPDIFKKKIEAYSEYKNFIPIFIEKFNLEKLRQIILENSTNDPQYLITTRLDNDDAISTNYIQMIQDNFSEQQFEIINFHVGYVWDENNGKLYKNGRGCNPFLSLIESSTNFKTIFLPEPHYQLYDLYKPSGQLKNIILESEPVWFQVVHGKNLSNHIEGIRYPKKDLGNDFVINDNRINQVENLVFLRLEQLLHNFNRMSLVKSLRTKVAMRTRIKHLLSVVSSMK